MLITKQDIEILNALSLDQAAQPNFEALKECLIWEDERPQSPLSREGREFLYDLWIIRGFLHRMVPENKWSISGPDPKYFKEVWAYGLANVAMWPGFKRLDLSEVDRAYLTACLQKSLDDL